MIRRATVSIVQSVLAHIGCVQSSCIVVHTSMRRPGGCGECAARNLQSRLTVHSMSASPPLLSSSSSVRAFLAFDFLSGAS